MRALVISLLTCARESQLRAGCSNLLSDVANVEQALRVDRPPRRADELVGVRAEPDAARFLDRAVVADGSCGARPVRARAGRCRNARPTTAPAASARIVTSDEAITMPTCRIMSSVDMSLAVARASVPTSGTSQACARATGRPSIRYRRSSRQRRLIRPEAEQRRDLCRRNLQLVAQQARARALRLREQRAEQAMGAPEIVPHRRSGDEGALALLAHQQLLADKLRDRLAQGDAADLEPVGEKPSDSNRSPGFSLPLRISFSRWLGKLPIERLGTRTAENRLRGSVCDPLPISLARMASTATLSHHITSYQGQSIRNQPGERACLSRPIFPSTWARPRSRRPGRSSPARTPS